jgi:hypothetical protein
MIGTITFSPYQGWKPQIDDRQIYDRYSRAGHPEAYEGRFYPGPHKFDRDMQHDAFSWLKAKLSY